MRTLISRHNHYIQSQRQQILYYQKIVLHGGHLTQPQEKQLSLMRKVIMLCRSLLSLANNACFKDLLNRVNTLPVVWYAHN